MDTEKRANMVVVFYRIRNTAFWLQIVFLIGLVVSFGFMVNDITSIDEAKAERKNIAVLRDGIKQLNQFRISGLRAYDSNAILDSAYMDVKVDADSAREKVPLSISSMEKDIEDIEKVGVYLGYLDKCETVLAPDFLASKTKFP